MGQGLRTVGLLVVGRKMRVTGAQPVIGAWTPIQACRVQVTHLWVPQDAAASDGKASDKVPCLDSCCVPAHASGWIGLFAP